MAFSTSLLRVFAPVALLAVSACTDPSFRASVNRFQAMPAPQGQSFFIKSDDPRLAAGLEFKSYADRVGGKLAALGYQQAANPEAASFVVKLAYGIDKGKERQQVIPGGGCFSAFYDPWCGGGFGGYYGGYRGYGGGRYGGPNHWGGGGFAFGFYDPFLMGYGNRVESYTVYTSDLSMKIEKVASGERLFEGSAKALSLNDNLPYLVPNLIEAMFTGFPGNSGETVRITVAPPSKQGRPGT
jgi:Domain of unknown function (DUF4136)